MGRQQPSPEEAIARLLYVAFIEIRSTARRRKPLRIVGHVDPDEDYHHHIASIADACHNLPGCLSITRRRVRRQQARSALEYLWTTASAQQIDWVRANLDDIGYGYSDLDKLRSDTIEKLRADGLLA